MKLALLILTIILFVTNNFICDFVYPESDQASIDGWNITNKNIFHLVIFLSLLNLQLFINEYKAINKWYQFVLYIGLGFTSSDVIDRMVFETREFCVISDSIMVTIVLIAGYRKYLIQKLK